MTDMDFVIVGLDAGCGSVCLKSKVLSFIYLNCMYVFRPGNISFCVPMDSLSDQTTGVLSW